MGSTTPSPLPSTSLDDAYRFKLVDGKVTQLEEFDDGRWKSERIKTNETWKFDGTSSPTRKPIAAASRRPSIAMLMAMECSPVPTVIRSPA